MRRVARWGLSVLRGLARRLEEYVLRDEELEAAIVPLALHWEGAGGLSWFDPIVNHEYPVHRGYLATSAAGALYFVEPSHPGEPNGSGCGGQGDSVAGESRGETGEDGQAGVELDTPDSANPEGEL